MKILAGIAGLFLIVGAFAQGQGPQAGIITGRIETDRSGVRSPVRRAKVTLSREGATDAPTTTTDADARYRFDGLAPGKYSVTVEKPGFVPIKSAAIDVAGASRTADLSLIPGGALEGRLQDDRAGPIAKLPVLADRLSEQGSVAASFAATTDDLGHFRIHSLPAGRYRIRATPPPPASGDEYFYPGTKTAKDAVVIAVTAGVTSDQLDFTVPIAPLSPIAAAAIEGAAQGAGNPVDPKATRITGTVSRSDSGQAIANATAELSDQYGVVRHHAQAGLDGRFEIAKVPAGVWTLSATASGFASVDGSVLRPSGAGIRLTVKDGDRIQKDVVLARVSAIRRPSARRIRRSGTGRGRADRSEGIRRPWAPIFCEHSQRRRDWTD
jgi:hypothetical protein